VSRAPLDPLLPDDAVSPGVFHDGENYTEPAAFNPVAADYTLYDIEYQTLTVSQWHIASPDQVGLFSFWDSRNRFEPSAFLANVQTLQQCNNCRCLIFLLICLTFLIVLFLFVFLHRKSGSFWGAYIGSSKIWAMAFCVGLFWNGVEFVLLLFIPSELIRFGVVGTALIAVGCTIFAFLKGVQQSVAMAIAVVVASMAFFAIYRHGATFSGFVTKFCLWRFFSVPVILIWYFGLLVVSVCAVFVGQIALYCTSLRISWAIFLPLGYVYWFLVNLVGQIIYHLIAQVAGVAYFTRTRRTQWRCRIWSRALVHNLGISVFNAAVIPLISPFYRWAQLTPNELRYRLRGLPDCLGRLVAGAFTPLHLLGICICIKFDQWLAFPSERGAVYSAFFGVPRAEGTRRIAEIDARVCQSAQCELPHRSDPRIHGMRSRACDRRCYMDGGWNFRRRPQGDNEDRRQRTRIFHHLRLHARRADGHQGTP
jgi:hypothetical protein